MTKLVMTRNECARQIYRVASDLRYNMERISEPADDDESYNAISYEIDARQNIHALVQLLQVMNDLT